MRATNGRGAALHHPPPGIASRVIGRASIPRTISPNSAAGCMQTDMPGSRTFTARAPSARSPAWPMSGASSSTSTARRAPPSPKRPLPGSRNSMPSRRRPEGHRQIAALNCEAPIPPRSSTIWSAGLPCNSPRSQPNPRLLRPSAMPWPAWNACGPISTTACWSWTITPPNAACAPSRVVSHCAPLLQVSGNIGSWSRLTV